MVLIIYTKNASNLTNEYRDMSATCDFQQCGILSSVDPDEPVQSLLKLRNSEVQSVA